MELVLNLLCQRRLMTKCHRDDLNTDKVSKDYFRPIPRLQICLPVPSIQCITILGKDGHLYLSVSELRVAQIVMFAKTMMDKVRQIDFRTTQKHDASVTKDD